MPAPRPRHRRGAPSTGSASCSWAGRYGMTQGPTRERVAMDQSNQGPAGGITAHLTIRGNRGADAIDFYSKAFGAEEIGRHMADDGKRIMHAHLKLNGGHLMLNDDFPEFGHGAATAPASVTLHLQVKDADAA